MIAIDTRAVRVSYFAAARELCGTSEEQVPIETALSARELVTLLGARHSRLGPLAHRMRVAVNGEIVGDDALVHPGDEVAVLPPVAGGSPSTNSPVAEPSQPITSGLSSEVLSVDRAIAAVSHAGAGGIAVFIGAVRDHADGKSVARLDYEAHDALADKELRAVLEEVARAQPEARLYAMHRVGELHIGDLAIVVAASAPHRAEAFAACREAIEQIKKRVPIWKKEWSPDGTANWVNL
jgi:molybdopterin synthase catalytic subunit